MGEGVPEAADAALVAAARRGDLGAFERIVERYQRRVYAVGYRILRRHDLADDVAQEAFLRAYQALDRFDTSRPFGPWIARIAANLAVNHARSPRFREQALPEAHAETPDGRAGPLGAVLEGEAREVLEAALARLPAEQRAVFVLRVAEELSYREIADALGLALGTVMSRLARAREKLREALGPYLGTAALGAGGEP